MNHITLIGLAAAALTTLAFLPQAIRVWKLRETRDLALSTFMMFTVGVFLWLVYGLLRNDLPVIMANLITFILAATILGFKFKYG
ncbi:hypothetical protein GF323_05435 [Candidatus Woesearchaeota archaeon]|nr:hypothetical protein [Candidatus Woesearchaeota archaeon]